MRRVIILLSVICGAYVCAFGQIYSVYRPAGEAEKPVISQQQEVIKRWAIGLEAVSSSGAVRDAEGEEVAKQFVGARADVWRHVWRGLWLGAEGEMLSAVGQKTHALTRMKRQHVALVSKWILTPNTNSVVYIMGGIGRSDYQTKFELQSHNLKAHSTLYLMGVGGDILIYKSLYATIAYRFSYDEQAWRNFVLRGPHSRQEISAGLLWAF